MSFIINFDLKCNFFKDLSLDRIQREDLLSQN